MKMVSEWIAWESDINYGKNGKRLVWDKNCEIYSITGIYETLKCRKEK